MSQVKKDTVVVVKTSVWGVLTKEDIEYIIYDAAEEFITEALLQSVEASEDPYYFKNENTQQKEDTLDECLDLHLKLNNTETAEKNDIIEFLEEKLQMKALKIMGFPSRCSSSSYRITLNDGTELAMDISDAKEMAASYIPVLIETAQNIIAKRNQHNIFYKCDVKQEKKTVSIDFRGSGRLLDAE